jgi:hypothetical protein
MAKKTARKPKHKAPARKRNASSAENRALEDVLTACSVMTNNFSYGALKKSARDMAGRTFEELGIKDTRMFKDVLKQILDPVASQIENIDVRASDKVSSVAHTLAPLLSKT